VRFEISDLADSQIEQIDAWWRVHRPGAWLQFYEDLASVQRLLCDNPELGIRYAVHRDGEVRRILLSSTPYHLYYQYYRERDEIFVLEIRGAKRKGDRGF
jgi:plasmid stabilization system protein ParE